MAALYRFEGRLKCKFGTQTTALVNAVVAVVPTSDGGWAEIYCADDLKM